MRFLKRLLWAGLFGLDLLIFLLFAVAVAGTSGDKEINFIIFILFVLVTLVLFWSRSWVISKADPSRKTKNELILEEFEIKNNLKFDAWVSGSIAILFDTKSKRMAFWDGRNIVDHPYNYIRSWECSYLERNGKTYQYKFDLKLNDLDRPVMTIVPGDPNAWGKGSAEKARIWESRLQLLLEGATV